MLIQIVDDSANMREAIKSVLGELNAEYVESGDGDEAVRQFALHTPDLVLMDIQMHRMDGIAATAAIRSIDAAARVIVLTQYDDDDLRAAASFAGAEAYVVKDDLSVLQDMILHPP